MKVIVNALINALCGEKSPSELSTSIYNARCLFHKPYLASNKCKGKKCSNLVCGECINSPLKGYCFDCTIKEITRNIIAVSIGGAVGLIYDICFLVANISNEAWTAKPHILIAYLLFELITCMFWFHGARKWAQIGHAERGFADPEGLKYPLYGSWLMWHWFWRFVYYLCFISFPFFIGPFVGIPEIIRNIRQASFIKKACRSNEKN